MENLNSYWDVIIICDETLINMGYGTFFNDENPRTEHEFNMLFKDGIAEEVNIVNNVPEIKTNKKSIILEYPTQKDITENGLKEVKRIMGEVDFYHIALLYGKPKYRHMNKSLPFVGTITLYNYVYTQHGYKPYFNGDDEYASRRIKMLIDDGIAKEVVLENNTYKIKDNNPITLVYPKLKDLTQEQIRRFKIVKGKKWKPNYLDLAKYIGVPKVVTRVKKVLNT